MRAPDSLDLILVPRPRELRTSGAGLAALQGEARFERVGDLPAQGYALRADSSGVEIRHSDDAGRRYSLQTLAQLRRHAEPLPGLEVRDWPDLPVRGYMLDISRDRVPTRETLARIVEVLALLKLNHLELYTEHTFAFREHEAVWRDASPMTHEDLRWLDDLCKQHGIELVANQNTFGHMGRWLRHDAYRDRAEAPDGWKTSFGMELEPAVLEPTPDNAAFALGLVREMMECVSSRRVNIGCDETFELGRGRSQAEVEMRGRGRVYFDHLQRLLGGLQEDGCEVLFWGDILRQHPELVPELPEQGTVGLAWWYEAPLAAPSIPESARALAAEFGISEAAQRGFRGHVPAFARAERPFWVCPGTSTWNSFIGRWDNARANLLDAAEVGIEQGAGGMLITDWGDNGHMQPPSLSWLPLAWGAAASWCLSANRDLDVAAALDAHVFGDEAGELGRALESIGDAYLGTGRMGMNSSSLFGAVVNQGALGAIGDPDALLLRDTIDQLGEASARIQAAHPTSTDGEVVRRELTQAVALARHGARYMLSETGSASPDRAELAAELASLIEEQRACWLLRSRRGGLDDSIARLERALASYRSK